MIKAQQRKYFMKTFLNLFFLVLNIDISAQHVVPSNSNSLIEIKREKYFISCPKLWTVDTSKMFGVDLIVRSPKVDSADQFIENLNIFIQDLNGRGYNLLKMGQESESQIKNMVTDVEIIESRLDSSRKPSYYILKYAGRQGKYSMTTTQHYYLKDEIGFALTLTVEHGKEQAYTSAAEEIFSSFKFY